MPKPEIVELLCNVDLSVFELVRRELEERDGGEEPGNQPACCTENCGFEAVGCGGNHLLGPGGEGVPKLGAGWDADFEEKAYGYAVGDEAVLGSVRQGGLAMI